MKTTYTVLLLTLSLGLVAGCNKSTPEPKAAHSHDGAKSHSHGKDGDHSHDGAKSHSHGKDGDHSHAKTEAKDEHGHAHDDDHKDDDHGHEHDRIIAGPNGGRVITSVEPHVELFVMADRKIQFTALNDDLKAIPLTGQTASIIGGDRTNPTKMSFAIQGDTLVSDVGLPDGKDIPIVLKITPAAGAKAVTEKIQLDLRDCPECDNQEYACTCDHAH